MATGVLIAEDKTIIRLDLKGILESAGFEVCAEAGDGEEAVASLAVTEFMVFVTSMREPAAQLTYRGEVPVFRRSLDAPESGCYYCSGIWGS